MKNAIVLAAGQGTRMQSSKQKVLHEILGKPIIELVVDNLERNGFDHIVVVVGPDNDEIKKVLGSRVSYAIQEKALGTIDAISKVTQLKELGGDTLILNGDYGLIQQSTIEHIFSQHQGHDMSIITAKPTEMGTSRRVIRDSQGDIDRIVDFDDADGIDPSAREITMGVYCINNQLLYKYLPALKSGDANAQANTMGLVEVMKRNGHSIQGIYLTEYRDLLGINDRTQLVAASRWLQNRINQYWLDHGVTIIDTQSTYIGPEVVFQGDNVVYPNNHIYGTVSIGKNTTLLPNNWINDAQIGSDVTIDNATITDSFIGDNTTVGPFAQIRMHSHVEGNARIGNFVELKNVEFGNNSKSAHLSYLGDARIGQNVNVGCGVVTANYDGSKKHRTVIGDGTFVGSHTTIVAPVNIGEGVLTAAGSVISDDVEDGAMAIARSRQTNKPGYGKKFKNKG